MMCCQFDYSSVERFLLFLTKMLTEYFHFLEIYCALILCCNAIIILGSLFVIFPSIVNIKFKVLAIINLFVKRKAAVH